MPRISDDRTAAPPPEEGHAARCISRRPVWADEVRIEAEAISYWWTAPTQAISIEPNGDECSTLVELVREDMLYVNSDGVVIDPGPERIFLLDTNLDVENARKLAAAILECCHRIDAPAAEQ